MLFAKTCFARSTSFPSIGHAAQYVERLVRPGISTSRRNWCACVGASHDQPMVTNTQLRHNRISPRNSLERVPHSGYSHTLLAKSTTLVPSTTSGRGSIEHVDRLVTHRSNPIGSSSPRWRGGCTSAHTRSLPEMPAIFQRAEFSFTSRE